MDGVLIALHITLPDSAKHGRQLFSVIRKRSLSAGKLLEGTQGSWLGSNLKAAQTHNKSNIDCLALIISAQI